ncbi:MAG: YIP1 family protein [Bdellovibrionales bacterium]
MKKIDWSYHRQKLREAIVALPNFLKNPAEGMRQLPDWEWPTLLALQIAFGTACATLANIIERDIVGFFADLILAPVAIVAVTSVGSAIFLYGFQFGLKREIPFRAIYTHLVFAGIPFQVANIVQKLVPPIVILGLAASLVLLYIGFMHNYSVNRKILKRIFIGVFVIFAASWGTQFIRDGLRQEKLKAKYSPEDLKLLEKEMGTGE